MTLPLFSRALALLPLLGLALACSDDPATNADATATPDGSGGLDATANPDATTNADGGVQDAAPGADLAPGADAVDPGDTGVPPTPDMVPGQHVTFAEGRIALGSTFAQVKQVLGTQMQRTPGNTNRSYDWNLAGSVQATVWFANSNQDTDDQPPGDVDETDQVLWIAVTGQFNGTTPESIGIGSMRAASQAAYGASPHSVPITNPAGTLDTYYTRGILIAYDPNNAARTITICKAYGVEPAGTLDIVNGVVDFGSGRTIRTGSILLGGGTSQNDVRTLMSAPETSGEVSFGAATLDLDTWSFIGFEVFYGSGGDTAFVAVHGPYYGQVGNGGAGFGSTRTDFEAFLTAQNFAPGVASSTQQNVICYKHNAMNRALGATYAMAPPNELTLLIVGFPLVQGNCP